MTALLLKYDLALLLAIHKPATLIGVNHRGNYKVENKQGIADKGYIGSMKA
jgi:hypothetical protein